MGKLWGGRFNRRTNPWVERFTKSIQVDKRLAEFDCLVSIAHAQMLGKCGIITRRDSIKIVSGLKSILEDVRKGKLKYGRVQEDIHTCIYNALYKKIGKAADRLHTARSRNDQVATDLRLYIKNEINSIAANLYILKGSVNTFAKKNIDVIVPGFTHLQHAQPVLLAHHMHAYCQMLDRDMERLQDCRKRVDILPLGACALSGTGLPIDRKFVARKLGFSRIASNSMDAVSDRDFVIEFIFDLSVIAMHLSRVAEDLIIWSSQEFSLLDLAEDFATGSSMMPQKKNPDVLELIRGKCGAVYGCLVDILTVMKGLPLTYNRDMQQDKESLFKAVDTVKDSLYILALFFKNLRINKLRAQELLEDEGLYATDIMEYLVSKGVSLKDAHSIVGKIMALCLKKRLSISEITLNRLRSFSPKFDKDVYNLLDPKKSVRTKNSYGGTSPEAVKRWIKDV